MACFQLCKGPSVVDLAEQFPLRVVPWITGDRLGLVASTGMQLYFDCIYIDPYIRSTCSHSMTRPTKSNVGSLKP
jgi:hypothetical protein